MRGKEVWSRSEDPKGFNCFDIAVLKMNKPTRYVGVGDPGDDFFQIHWLTTDSYVGKYATRYGVAKTVIVAYQTSQIKFRTRYGPIVISVCYNDWSTS